MPGYRWKRAGGGLDWIELRSTTTFLDDDETMVHAVPRRILAAHKTHGP